jgi:hypothetical protein
MRLCIYEIMRLWVISFSLSGYYQSVIYFYVTCCDFLKLKSITSHFSWSTYTYFINLTKNEKKVQNKNFIFYIKTLETIIQHTPVLL